LDKSAEHCKHAIPAKDESGRSKWIYARCDHPKCRDGAHRSYCTTQRQGYGVCGAGAVLFEVKNGIY
jgi:hypothetical protein